MSLIDKKELKEWVENWFYQNKYYHPYSKSNNIPCSELYDILDRMPTINAVEVVRCKDCKWFDREEPDHPYGYCHAAKHGYMTSRWEISNYRKCKDDFYCADGERRTE